MPLRACLTWFMQTSETYMITSGACTYNSVIHRIIHMPDKTGNCGKRWSPQGLGNRELLPARVRTESRGRNKLP